MIQCDNEVDNKFYDECDACRFRDFDQCKHRECLIVEFGFDALIRGVIA